MLATAPTAAAQASSSAAVDVIASSCCGVVTCRSATWLCALLLGNGRLGTGENSLSSPTRPADAVTLLWITLQMMIVNLITFTTELFLCLRPSNNWGRKHYVSNCPSTRLWFKVACLVRQSLSGQAPLYLADDCCLVSDSTRRSLRSADVSTCVVLRTLGSYGERTFAAAGPRLWNSLPVHLRNPDITYDITCSDDSWKDIFIGKHEHGALWLLICGAIHGMSDVISFHIYASWFLPPSCG